MRTPFLWFSIFVCVLSTMACSGTMKGVDRYSGKRVYFDYQDEKFGTAQLQITMPDGEHFIGKLLEKPAPRQSGKEYPAIEEFPGNTEALLFGDRGTEMRCKFRLSDRVMGFKSGGFGLCETSEGHIIDIFTR
ncbi:MAG: hypothetical protein JRE88_07220 [Deltaproteobacteria bacterium]|nr:hypothetical protein [Deltaproteobacteria bacterium]MBW2516555.1 hypothetical protein [Deltaproteobacteria bacterium]